jgi:PhnB protein
MKASKVPAGPQLVPTLSVKSGAKALEFYARAFGAVEVLRLVEPGGKLAHAEIEIAGARLWLAEEYPEIDFLSPETRGGTTVTLTLYVEDVDAAVERAVAAGATLARPPHDEFYGERVAQVRDPSGHRWSLQTRLEEVSNEEIARRFEKLIAG